MCRSVWPVIERALHCIVFISNSKKSHLISTIECRCGRLQSCSGCAHVLSVVTLQDLVTIFLSGCSIVGCKLLKLLRILEQVFNAQRPLLNWNYSAIFISWAAVCRVLRSRGRWSHAVYGNCFCSKTPPCQSLFRFNGLWWTSCKHELAPRDFLQLGFWVFHSLF